MFDLCRRDSTYLNPEDVQRGDFRLVDSSFKYSVTSRLGLISLCLPRDGGCAASVLVKHWIHFDPLDMTRHMTYLIESTWSRWNLESPYELSHV